jgi:hypothetical protein
MSEDLKQRFNDLAARMRAGATKEVSGAAELQSILGPLPGAVAEVFVFAASAGEPDAITIAEALRRYGGPDGKLHIKDPFEGTPGGGRMHVFDLPAGATHIQVFHRLST